MQLLGDLIRLPKGINDLPLPWWHRSPLGLIHGTFVHLALVKTSDRPVGDLVLSVIDPDKWDHLIQIECSERDKPGVIRKVFAAVKPLNIALAETATLETRITHRATLICEPVASEETGLLRKRIRATLQRDRFKNIVVRRHPLRAHNVVWSDAREIEHGWVRGCNLKEDITEQFPQAAGSGVDLTRAVVSADTEQRVLRFIFPRTGARTITIHHKDVPGALERLTDVLADCNLNVLSSLLRRGGAGKGKAIFIAVCEPDKKLPIEPIIVKVREKLRKLPRNLWVHRPKVRDGRDPRNVIYPSREDEVVARVPDDLLPTVRAAKGRLRRGRLPVFISRRFLDEDSRAKKVLTRISEVLEANGCFPVQALPEPGGLKPTPYVVASKMWISRAGIVLVLDAKDSDQAAFSKNLAHEVGFLQGQGKPILVLVEDGCEDPLKDVANLLGVNAPRLAKGESVFNPSHPGSIDQRITRWSKSLKNPDLV